MNRPQLLCTSNTFCCALSCNQTNVQMQKKDYLSVDLLILGGLQCENLTKIKRKEERQLLGRWSITRWKIIWCFTGRRLVVSRKTVVGLVKRQLVSWWSVVGGFCNMLFESQYFVLKNNKNDNHYTNYCCVFSSSFFNKIKR